MNNIDYKKYFKDKRVTQLGLGLLGRGLGDAIFLAECGAELVVTDLKTEEELKTSVDKLKQYPNVILHLGGHDLADFKDRDFILKGAGVPLDSIYITEARKNNIPIEMDSSLFCKLLPPSVKVVGVTGTRGKSTVTHLINHILKTAGKHTILGGNVRDMATLPYIKDVVGDEIVVLELDSWQLQGFGESQISPNVSVFTTFMPDHLNYYKNDLDKYFEDKANIFKYQTDKDFLVLGENVSLPPNYLTNLEPSIVIAKKENVPQDWSSHLLGDHNKLNISCAVEACRTLGISDEDIKNGVETFGGVEGRLQFVKKVNGVKIYNDNNATTPQATIAGLKAVSLELGAASLKTILIIGGADKNIEPDDLVENINETCKIIILLPGSGSDKLQALSYRLKAKVSNVQNLSEAVAKAIEQAEAGDTILFSPAFASFGPPPGGFKNEYERNDEFMKIVNSL
jgi:UDP-N-acetylmuramoylalanine--D-glutamate ligase